MDCGTMAPYAQWLLATDEVWRSSEDTLNVVGGTVALNKAALDFLAEFVSKDDRHTAPDHFEMKARVTLLRMLVLHKETSKYFLVFDQIPGVDVDVLALSIARNLKNDRSFCRDRSFRKT